MRQIYALFAISALLLTTGCSTIVNGKTQSVSINSNVSDADIKVNGVKVGKTPFTGALERSSKAIVEVSKDGYESKTVTLDTAFEPIFWGNIIVGGVFGSTTDASTGSMYKYAPATVQVDLVKK